MEQGLDQHQIQEQRQLQQQRITQQQLLNVKLLSMSLAELEQNVAAELNDNPALEEAYDDDRTDLSADSSQSSDNDEDTNLDEPTEETMEKEERQDELNQALENMGSDDDMDCDRDFNYRDSADYEEMVYGDTQSFYDKLNGQMGEMELSDKEQRIMEYLIGSLDNDGLLRKDLDTIADELAIYDNTDASVEEVEEVLHKLQTFDPPGIAGRSLRECLRLQVERMDDSRLKERMLNVIDHHFEDFTKKRWESLKNDLALDELQMQTLMEGLRKLNPKPGAAMGETIGRNMHQITPDFIVYTTDDGRISFDINNGNLPSLRISDSFEEMLNSYSKMDDRQMNKANRDAVVYIRRNMEKARWYMEAIRKRQQTMTLTMQAIINWQRKFFLEGDESDLRPMILKDIAEKTGLDISTISRVSNEKYAQTQWGTFPLRFFFTDGYTKENGEELSTRKIKLALKDIVDKEDKKCPLSDEAIVKIMKKQGFPIARRTVAKYRDQLGIPKSLMRRN
jgi:RNA polymerase sigma-54 factor